MSKVKPEKRYVQEFFVAPDGGSFPLDMLRYDQCYFEDENEAYAVQNAASVGGDAVTGAIKLIRVGRTAQPPTAARWASFGWKLTDGTHPREAVIRLARLAEGRRPAPATEFDVVERRRHGIVDAEAWNARYEEGLAVRYFPVRDDFDHIETRTRSRAWMIGSDAVVLVAGRRGGVLLEHLIVVEDEGG